MKTSGRPFAPVVLLLYSEIIHQGLTALENVMPLLEIVGKKMLIKKQPDCFIP